MLGKNKIAGSGREEACKACTVIFGSDQEGIIVLLAVFLRSRPCSDSLSALPMSVYEILEPHGPFCGLDAQSAHLPYYGVL